MLHQPFYDPEKTFEENYKNGPYGAFADGKIYENVGEPTKSFFGHKVYLPFGIAAGPLYNGRFVKAALDKGFDIVTHKTVRPGLFPCNPFPNILGLPQIKGNLTLEQAQRGVVAKNEYKEPLNILNSYNNPSFDPAIWQNDLRNIKSYLKKGQVLSCSLEARPNDNAELFIDDWVKGVKLIQETEVDIVELNTSCPNAGKTNLLCFDIVRMKNIVERIRREVSGIKLIIKMSFFSDDDLLKELIKSIGNSIDGFAAINTIQAKIIDEKGNLKLTGGREKAGVSGDSVRWLGLDMVARLKKHQRNFKMNYKIIGMGGVMNAKHYQEYLDAGADTAMAVTGVLWNPYLAQEIKKKAIKR